MNYNQTFLEILWNTVNEMQMTQMISHEIEITDSLIYNLCGLCDWWSLSHVSKDGSVHDLEKVV